jgi:hypothetical protein
VSHKVIENSTEVYRGQHESCEIVQNTMERKNRTHTNTLQTTAPSSPHLLLIWCHVSMVTSDAGSWILTQIAP